MELSPLNCDDDCKLKMRHLMINLHSLCFRQLFGELKKKLQMNSFSGLKETP